MLNVDVEPLLRKLHDRRAQLNDQVFSHPPKDWPEFRERLGQYNEVVLQIEELSALVRGEELDAVVSSKKSR